jgi:hypothetical protein
MTEDRITQVLGRLSPALLGQLNGCLKFAMDLP